MPTLPKDEADLSVCFADSLFSEGRFFFVQPLSLAYGSPAPLVGEPLAKRESLLNAKASPTRRGVTEGDGEVVRRISLPATMIRNGNAACGTTSQALRASSPGRKDSLRPEGDVANSDRGRTTTGEPVVTVLDEQSFSRPETTGLRG